MTLTRIRPVADGLFTGEADEARLIGGRCRACGEWHFPAQENCPHCAALDIERAPLSRTGALWTWTVQGFAPPVPPFVGDTQDFVPFGVGYVELPEGLCVQARLTLADPQALAIGMPMALTTEVVHTAAGEPLLSYAFRPAV